VSIAGVIASPAWRRAASGGGNQQRQFTAEIGRRLGRPGYQPPEDGDAIAHWLKYDARRPPSRPEQTFPDTRQHGAIRPTRASTRSRDRNDRSAAWFGLNRRGGSVILHHRHIRRVLIREWSPTMDGITATIFASRATIDLHRCAMDQTNQNGSSERSAGDPDRRATESAT
jgi:hypothetical protein